MNAHPPVQESDYPGQVSCPVCEIGASKFYARIDGYEYLRCADCGSLHVDTTTLDAIDAGKSTRRYDESYWSEELKSARERASGESLVRTGEAILYARRHVRRFLDIGTGPGYLLDELARYFPSRADTFHGVELFPPDEHSKHPNYIIGDVGNLRETYDAGVCIEVIEHLTPRMLEHLVDGLARISEPDSLWLFNTSLAERTLREDPGYLDPLHRGHIVSYSLKGLRRIFEPRGFRLQVVPGKNYAFVAEFDPSAEEGGFENRIARPVPPNEALLKEFGLMYQAAFESARSSFYQAQYLARSKWALDTNTELDASRHLNMALQREHERTARWAHALDGELAEARRLHAALQQEHERTAQWAHALDGELAEARRSYVALQHEQMMLLNSRSWRYTQPLRAMVGWLRGVRESVGPSSASGVHHEVGDSGDGVRHG